MLNWDQARVKLVPSQNWTMEEQGSSRVEIAGINDKRQITLTLAGAMSGERLPLELLYQGKTVRCHPHYSYPSEFDVWHTPNHWANEETTLRFINNVILPYMKAVRVKNNTPDQGPLVVYDVFKGLVKNRIVEKITQKFRNHKDLYSQTSLVLRYLTLYLSPLYCWYLLLKV